MENIGSTNKTVGGRRTVSQPRGGIARAPFFSIITISYNDASALSRSLDAISAQSFRDFEIIIVDGGSTDETLNVLNSRAGEIDLFISEPDNGIYQAINKGIQLARGETVGLIHADDILAFNALNRYHQAFLKNNADIVLGDCCYFAKSGKLSTYKPARNYGAETIFRGITAAHEAIFIRRSVYKQFGTYDETYRSAADFKLISKMVLSGVTTATTNFVEVFKEEGGASFSKDVEFQENFRLMREYAPHVSEAHYEHLLKLKNYRKLTPSDVREIYNLIPDLNVPSYVLRALSSSLLAIMQNDSSSSSMTTGRGPAAVSRATVDPRRVLFCVCAIKGVAGGAERVLIDIASNLCGEGNEVLIGCAEGRAGVPYYQPSRAVDLVDIFAPPYNAALEADIDLERELLSIISRMPREILVAVLKCKDLRDSFLNWRQFVDLCGRDTALSDEAIRDLLRSEIGGWIGKHGARVRRWRGLIMEFKPAITVPFMISASTEVYIAARGQPTKVIISNHGNPIRDYLYQDDWDDGLLDRSLRLFAIMSAGLNIWLQNEFLDFVPIGARRRSVVIPNPVRGAPDVAFTSRKQVILGVGRFIPVKRFDLVIRAFSIISSEFPKWTLELYGKGPSQGELEELAGQLSLSGSVKFMGTTPHIFDVYNRGAFLVSSSEMEGFGLTVAEALASGLPVIGPRSTAGINSLVRDGITGLLVDDVGLVNNLADAMRRLMHNSPLRRELGERARIDMETFSINRVVNAWSDTLFGDQSAAMAT